jgi:hypothetical protein
MGRKIECEVRDKVLINDYDQEIDGIEVECSECGHTVEAFGTSEISLRYALRELRESCPESENNFYVVEDE